MPKVLICSTSAGFFGADNKPTGLWIEELASPYYIFKAAGFEVTLASVSGGAIPIDAGSMGENFFTDYAKKFMHDGEAIGAFCHTKKLADHDVTDYDCLFIPGGHGCVADMVNNPVVTAAVEKMYAADKVVCAVCHGPVALVGAKKPDGSALVEGLAVTGFSSGEEAAVGLTDVVPFVPEAKLIELGGKYEKGDDWNPKACVAGKLVTGQNPQSSEVAANACVELLK